MSKPKFMPRDLASLGFTNMPAEAIAAYDRANTLRALDLLPVGSKVLSKSAAGFLAVVPPGARAAERLAVSNHSLKQPPLRQQVLAAKPTPSKGSEMPALATPKNQDSKSAPKRPIVPTPNFVTPNLKAFNSTIEAYNAGMSLMAGLGRNIDNRKAVAETYCRERGLEVFNAALVSDPAKGGYLVPDELTRAILVNMSRIGAARRLATFVPMTSASVAVPVELSGPAIQYISEYGEITGADAEWGQIRIEAHKRGAIGYISDDLNGDALVRYTDTYVDSVSRALARVEDREFAIADGTSSFGGEVGLIATLAAGGTVEATGADAWEELTMAHFGALVAKLPEQYADGSEGFICSSSFYAMGMLRAAGGAAQGFAEDGTPLFMGKKVHLLSAMPSTSAAEQVCCLYGNWRESALFGDRGLRFAISTKSPQVFDKGLIALRAISRYGLVVRNGGTASAAGSFVGLKTAASS